MVCTVHRVPSKTEHRQLNFGFASSFFSSEQPLSKKKKKEGALLEGHGLICSAGK